MQGGSKKASGGANAAVIRTARKPNTAVALYVGEEGATGAGAPAVTLDLCIRHTLPDGSKDLLVKGMAREPTDTAQKTLERIRLLFAPPRPKQGVNKKFNREDLLAACPAVSALEQLPPTDGEGEVRYGELDTNLPNKEFWARAKVLCVGEERVEVKFNIPTITEILPPSKPFVGLPVVCSNITTVYAQEEDLSYEWCLRGGAGASAGTDDMTVLSREPAFEPTEEMLGKRLVLRVTPDIEDGLWTQVELPPVQMPPSAVARWDETPTDIFAPAFRVVSYNILYDDFCTSKSCKAKIYPFASDEVLDIENRQVRILQELLAYHADIVCLQECGKKLFHKYLLPAMSARGYDGFYANKSGNVQEGCGFLFRKERFSLVREDVVALNWASLEEREPQLAEKVATHAELKEALGNVTSIGAVLTLREAGTGRELVLGNTHLFYHANACHIRILQMHLFLACLHRAATEGAAADVPQTRPIVLCGDCNFTHTTGAYRLVTTGQVEGGHHSWEKGKLFYWGCDRQLGYSADQLAELMGEVGEGTPSPTAAQTKKRKGEQLDDAAKAPEGEAGAEASGDGNASPPSATREPLTEYFHDTVHGALKLVDSYYATDPSLPWTNFTMTFREVIDYIFFSEETIDVLRTVPIPPESELAENFALPNAKYPSDHVALIADLVFKK